MSSKIYYSNIVIRFKNDLVILLRNAQKSMANEFGYKLDIQYNGIDYYYESHLD